VRVRPAGALVCDTRFPFSEGCIHPSESLMVPFRGWCADMSRLLLASFLATATGLGMMQPRSSAMGATRRSTCLTACADRPQAVPALCVLDLDMCVWSPEVRR